jgi:circadian clock protein KaiC
MGDGALQYLPFIVDCVVALTHEVENGFSRRRVRVIKYRGSSFSENETPFIIGARGLEVERKTEDAREQMKRFRFSGTGYALSPGFGSLRCPDYRRGQNVLLEGDGAEMSGPGICRYLLR